MVEVIATSKGYYGGRIHEIGDCFLLDDAIWLDERRHPRWVRPARNHDVSIGKTAPGHPCRDKAGTKGKANKARLSSVVPACVAKESHATKQDPAAKPDGLSHEDIG